MSSIFFVLFVVNAFFSCFIGSRLLGEKFRPKALIEYLEPTPSGHVIPTDLLYNLVGEVFASHAEIDYDTD